MKDIIQKKLGKGFWEKYNVTAFIFVLVFFPGRDRKETKAEHNPDVLLF